MTELEKELLFTDLCGRVPYKPMLQIYWEDMNGDGYFNEELASVDNSTGTNSMYVNDRWIENVKVYLRPMSSMTEEERMKIASMANFQNLTKSSEIVKCCYPIICYCYSRHLDINELIDKGVALEAPEEMYN